RTESTTRRSTAVPAAATPGSTRAWIRRRSAVSPRPRPPLSAVCTLPAPQPRGRGTVMDRSMPRHAAQGRPRLTLGLAAIVLACALAAGHGPLPAGAAPSTKPNVVVILTDDQTLRDLYETTGAHGKGRKLMPKVRGLIG